MPNMSESLRFGSGIYRSHRFFATLLSLIPGFGQFYNRQFAKGAIYFVLLMSFYSTSHEFIAHGMWGLVTLGEKLPEDNSIFLLAEGIIASLVIAFGILVYALSINDAYKNGKLLDEGKPLNSIRVQYRNLINDGFPYLMISPGFVLLVFVVVFPIIFGFAIGFTNYNLYNSPPAKLVDWVGFKNLFNIFQINLWRNTFFDVLQWTVIWTLLASTLQCTVGVLLAILVNQQGLRYKALIRTIFILPWQFRALLPFLYLLACLMTALG